MIFFVRHLYRQTFGEEKGQKAPIKVEETEEQKAAWVKEELKKLKVEEEDEEKEGDLKVKQEEGAEPMKKVKVKRKELEEDEESSSEESSSSDDDEGGEKEVRSWTLFKQTYSLWSM